MLTLPDLGVDPFALQENMFTRSDQNLDPVSQMDDPAGQRDILSGEAGRIATEEAVMVMADRIGQMFELG